MKHDGFQSWIVICRGMNEHVDELDETLWNLFTTKRWLQARETRFDKTLERSSERVIEQVVDVRMLEMCKEFMEVVRLFFCLHKLVKQRTNEHVVDVPAPFVDVPMLEMMQKWMKWRGCLCRQS